MSSEIKVDTISEKTSAAGVTIDGVLVKDGAIASSYISGLSAGISEIDTWIINADITADTQPILDSQVTRMSKTLVEKVGTGMSIDGSGHWTFPSTGYYELKFIGSLENDTNSNATDIHIDATDDNFSTESRIFYGRYYGNDNSRVTMVANLVVKISDVANDKVKFDFNEVNTSTIHGDTAEFESGFIFTKLREL
jgi:hypothetical protein